MTNTRDRHDDRFAAAWQAFQEQDAALRAPEHLEASIVAALNAAPRRRRSATPFLLALAASLAAVVVTWSLVGTTQTEPATPLTARTMSLTALVAPVSPASPASLASPASPASLASPASPASPAEEIVVLMLFEPTPSPSETLQLVRLRVPGEALLALGLPPFEPDASGLVDIDMLVGDDGLPKSIRKIRMSHQEER